MYDIKLEWTKLQWFTGLEIQRYANDESKNVENAFEERQMRKVLKWRKCIWRKYRSDKNPFDKNPFVKSTQMSKIEKSKNYFLTIYFVRLSIFRFSSPPTLEDEDGIMAALVST